MIRKFDIVIVGAGFTGLTAAYALSKKGFKVCVLESDSSPGGLAGTFDFADGVTLEKFYHHWFNNDYFVPKLVEELGMGGDIITLPTKTGMYFNGQFWKLSSPLDLIRFKPLSLINRIRLGLVVLKIRKVKDWRPIEHLSIREWLEPLCGEKVYKVVWEPLILSKFSIYAEVINAVWMWKKLILRGGTRNRRGNEELAYFKGGFGKLAQAMVTAIESNQGVVSFNDVVTGVNLKDNAISSLKTSSGEVVGSKFLFTPAFPIIAGIFDGTPEQKWLESLRRVRYLGNMCLVLRLKRSLSDTYWINVNDPGFPFVGVIEHTNFDMPSNYNGSHIVYLSRYLALEDPVWSYSNERYVDYALAYLQRMFPVIDRSWLIDYHISRSEYAQPVTERNYSNYVPKSETPYDNALISTMAQIYPEDRGTNYAIREGYKIAEQLEGISLAKSY